MSSKVQIEEEFNSKIKPINPNRWIKMFDKFTAICKKYGIILSNHDINDNIEEFIDMDFNSDELEELSEYIVNNLLSTQRIYKTEDKKSYMSYVRSKGYISMSEHNMIKRLKDKTHRVLFRYTEFPIDENGRYIID